MTRRRADLATLVWMSVLATTLVWELSAGDRATFVERLTSGGMTRVALTMGLVGLGALTTALGLIRHEDETGLRRLRGLALGGTLALVATHAALAWIPTLRGVAPLHVYQDLRDALPTAPCAAVYALGAASLAVGLEPALRAAAAALGVRREATLRWVRGGSVLVPALFFIVLVNGLGHFMVGRAVFFGDAPPAAGPVPAEEAPEESEAPR